MAVQRRTAGPGAHRVVAGALAVVMAAALMALVSRSTPTLGRVQRPLERIALQAPADQVDADSLPVVAPDDAQAAVPASPTAPAVPAPAVPPPAADVATAPTFPSPIRGVWVHALDSTLTSRAGIDRMLDEVAAAGANTVVVQVARRNEALYASSVLPAFTAAPVEPGLDVLAHVTQGAAARGLSVHAWFTATLAWEPPAQGGVPLNWTYAEHGMAAPEEERWLTRRADGEWGDYLDLGHPGVQDLIVATAVELARYDIDAVHLDYIRYPGADYGYNPVALGRFLSETGRTEVPAADDPAFSDWRRQQTTDVVRRVRQAVTQANPSVGISAALISWGDGPVGGRSFPDTAAHRTVFQPWEAWTVEGLIDVAMPMLYFREAQHADFHRNWLSYVAGLNQVTDVIMAPGQASYLNSPDQSLAQLQAGDGYLDGEVLYVYQQTSVDGGPAALLSQMIPSGIWGS